MTTSYARAAMLVGAILVQGAVAVPAWAGDKVRVCVTVRTSAKLSQGLDKLVSAELAHHRSHVRAATRCDSRLTVQLFELAGVHFLTVRVNSEVPMRLRVRRLKDELDSKLRLALKRVLKHDPEFLARDVREYAGLQRALHSVLKRGHTMIRVELFETVLRSGSGAAFAPGLAFNLTRGSGHWRVFSRIWAGGTPGGTPRSGRTLRAMIGGELGVNYELFTRRMHSPYVSGGIGGQLFIFEGYAQPTDSAADTASVRGINATLRLGYRFFRAHTYDMDLFAAAYMPLGKTEDPDSTLINAYTPFFQIGMGVGF